MVAVYSPPPRHLTFFRCIALLYFAIRLESRKRVNKRIYLSIYLSHPRQKHDRLPDVSKTRDEPSRDRGKDTRRRGQQAVPIPTDTPAMDLAGVWLYYHLPPSPALSSGSSTWSVFGHHWQRRPINQSINRSTVHAASRGPSADPRHRGRATHASAARRRVNYTQTCACASAGVTKLHLYLLFTNTQLYFHRKM